MKNIFKISIVLLIFVNLVGCGRTMTEEGRGDPSININISENNLEEDNTHEDINNQSKFVRSDEDNLLEVRLEDNIARVKYNYPMWIDHYGYSKEYFEDGFFDQEFLIRGYTGKIKDLLVGKVRAFDHHSDGNKIEPSIFILMEDGTVNWVSGNISFLNPESPFLDCVGTITWIEGIESLSYEDDGQGLGEMTIYGIKEDKRRYDIKAAYEFLDMLNNTDPWVTDINIGGIKYFLKLDFYKNGFVDLTKNLIDEKNQNYQGRYDISFEVNQNLGPGLITFDLYPIVEEENEEKPDEIHGSYFAGFAKEDNKLELFYNDGDYLYDHQGFILDYGKFSYGFDDYGPYIEPDNWGYLDIELVTVEDYSNFLLKNAKKAREMVEIYGMSILVTDEYDNLGYDINFRYIWLGTNSSGKFTKEILFAIGDDGTILEYYPLGDGWLDVHYHIFG